MAKKAVGVELRKLSNLIVREVRKASKDFHDVNITEMHVNIIKYLMKAGNDGVMQKDLERVFTIRRSTASRILTLMEKNGVIERHGVDYDTRLKKITLTPTAIAHHKTMINGANKMEKRMTAGIVEEDLNVFFKVIEKMQENLTE